MTQRIYNFSAGPAVLPMEALEEAQRDLLNLAISGFSILEHSHRSAEYEQVHNQTIADVRELLGIPRDYGVLLVQGGATMQFAAVPANILLPGKAPDYILSGHWSKAAMAEAKKFTEPRVAATSEDQNFSCIPEVTPHHMNPQASYAHFTSNNTIYGTEWFSEPAVGNVPLVCDASSDLLSRPIDVSKYGLIYAGAQKNMGPAGVTLVIIRPDLLERTQDFVPTYFNYKVHAKNNSLYNTPPTFSIYMVGLVAKWLKAMGGLAEMERRNVKKASMLYDAIDASGYYKGTARKQDRSRMNVTFRLPSEALEGTFIKAALAAGFSGLKGHRNVGGCRASIYNAFPEKGVADLVAFMKDFAAKNG